MTRMPIFARNPPVLNRRCGTDKQGSNPPGDRTSGRERTHQFSEPRVRGGGRPKIETTG